MIVQVHAARFASTAVPYENQSPLLVDTDRMQAIQPTPQFLEVIAWRHSQVLICHCIVDQLYFPKQPTFQIGCDLLRPNIKDEEIPQPGIPKTDDHPMGSSVLVYHSMVHAATAHRDEFARRTARF
jgi:hypothetical protein